MLLPLALVADLARVVALEHAATTQAQRYAARRASGRLMLAATAAGWSSGQLAEATGLPASTIRSRVAIARETGGTLGLDVPSRRRTAAQRAG